MYGIDAGKHLWHALGRGHLKVGNGTDARTRLSQAAPARALSHALPFHRGPVLDSPGLRIAVQIFVGPRNSPAADAQSRELIALIVRRRQETKGRAHLCACASCC